MPKGLTMVAVGVNKAAEQYLILDERTREELASYTIKIRSSRADPETFTRIYTGIEAEKAWSDKTGGTSIDCVVGTGDLP